MCGSSGFQSDNTQSSTCSGCGFVFYINAAAAVSAIIECGECILLVTRARQPQKGKLDLPGGFVDHGETAEQALLRELHEELALPETQSQYLFSYPNHYPYKGFTYRTLDLFYLLSLETRPDLISADDISGYQWINSGNIPFENIAFESVTKALQQYLTIKRS